MPTTTTCAVRSWIFFSRFCIFASLVLGCRRRRTPFSHEASARAIRHRAAVCHSRLDASLQDGQGPLSEHGLRFLATDHLAEAVDALGDVLDVPRTVRVAASRVVVPVLDESLGTLARGPAVFPDE